MRRLSLLILITVLGGPLGAQDATRIVAIGDIHGSLDGLLSILQRSGLTSFEGHWTGGQATFVQTGDFMDRGEGVRGVMDRLMALESEAKDAGGKVVVLTGNHEVMNLIGLTRDATPAIFATFADANSEARRTAAWDQYSKVAAAWLGRNQIAAPVYSQTRDAWMAAHPPGYVEYREALGPQGVYGEWLRSKQAVASIVGTIFMHAGIPPNGAPGRLSDINDRVKDEIKRMDRHVQRLVERKLALPFFTLQEILQVCEAEIDAANRLFRTAKESGAAVDRMATDIGLLTEAEALLKINQWHVLNPDGPLWYRGYANAPDDSTGGMLRPLLARYSARRFVVGHTPLSRQITSRFGGRVWLIDTGMLTSVYKGRASAIEISGDRVTAIYDDGRFPLTAAADPAAPAFEQYQATVWRSPSSRPTDGR